MSAKRIVIATFGSYGDIHPAIALGLGLKARGHEVTIAVSEFYRLKIESEGLNVHAMRPDIGKVDPEVSNRLLNPSPTESPFDTLLSEILMPAVTETYEDLTEAVQNADLLIASDAIFVASIVAQKTGINWASYTLAPAGFFSAYDPPRLPGVPALPRFPILERFLVQAITPLARWRSARLTRPILELRQKLGLPAGEDPIFDQRSSSKCVIAAFSSVLGAPQPDWPRQTHQTGFVFYDRQTAHQGMPPELADFLASGAPPVVFTLGTSAVQSPGNFYTESFKAVKALNCRAVFLVGLSELNDLNSETTISLPYAPYSELFPRAAAVVHQGGVGTTAQGLRSGVPMLVVPFAFDQPDNAARVVRLGVARQIPKRDYNGDRAIAELKELLENSTYRTQAQQVKATIATEDGVKAACDVLEKTFF